MSSQGSPDPKSDPRFNPWAHEDFLSGCLDMVQSLELQLQSIQNSLVAAGGAAMQHQVEQQLASCQEMFADIETKVARLSSPGSTGQQRGGEPHVQQDAELLATRLELLKAELVSFQELLQDQHDEEEEQMLIPQTQRPLESIRRSSSVQELFSSPRNKLLRQSSLQQQKELEQELTEQRGLTQAIARHGSRAQLLSHEEPDGHGRLSSPSSPAGTDVAAAAAPEKWASLHSRLLVLEESWLLPPPQVTDSSARCGDGTAGRMIATESLSKLRSCTSRLTELDEQRPQSPLEGDSRPVEEALFDVLSGACLSLSSMSDLLLHRVCEEDLQLRQVQSLSAELDSFGVELFSQVSKVSTKLKSVHVQRCLDHLSKVLVLVKTTLTARETQIQNLQEVSSQTQAGVPLQQCLQQQVEQDTLQSQLSGLRSHCEGLSSSLDLQRLHRHLLHSLEDLVHLGRERLHLQASKKMLQVDQTPEVQVQKEQLQKDLHSHMKFFQCLDRRCSSLQYLAHKVRGIAPQAFEAALAHLQEEVEQLQERALERGTDMQQLLQSWSEWEDDSARLDVLLRRVETSCLLLQTEGDSEEQLLEKLSAYKDLLLLLEENEALCAHTLEAGRRLAQAGCGGVGAAIAKLDARWKSLTRRMKQEHIAMEMKRKLRSRLVQDSAALTDWMVKARGSITTWTEFAAAPHQTEQRRKFFLRAVALSAELEVQSELKVSVMNTAAQLEQLRTRGGDAVRRAEEEASGLRQVALDWAGLQADLPVIQQALHTLWMETQSQQGALQELQAWITAAESGMEEIQINQNHVSSSDLNRVLQYCKECQVEMSCHQATLDYVNQPLLTFISCSDHERRCEQNRFAEDQGGLNHMWLRVQGAISTQIQEAEQELKRRMEQDVCLQQVNSWIIEQNIWMEAAERTCNRAQLQRSTDRCLDLGEEIKHRSAALQEIRGRHCGGDADFLRQADASIQACAALTQRAESLNQKWTQDHQLWNRVEDKLKGLTLRAVRTALTLDLHGCPQICLQAHQRLHDRLQLAYQLVTASESELDGLTQLVSTLRGNICPAAAAIVDQRLQGLRDRWTVCVEVGERLQRSGWVLQMWRRYARRVASFSKRLQQLQSEAAAPVEINGRDDGVQRGGEHVHAVEALLQMADTLQSDLEEVLQACKKLIGHLQPSAATLVQSESRLLSRGVLRLRERLKEKLGRLQEDVSQLRYFGDVLDSLERNLQDWTQRLDAAAAEQSGLLELSGQSADLDVLNELSCCSPAPGDGQARRLQGLSRRWTDAAARAQEACSKLQTEALRPLTFEQRCGSWMEFLQRMEDGLAVDVSGSYVGLRQQLCTHKRFQAELSIGHQILHSVITEALQLLQRGEVEDRSDFILKLAQLREHWQGAVQRADQRRSLVEGLVKHWHQYRRSMRKLHRFLADTKTLLPPAGPLCRSLQELRHSLQDLQHAELLFQRYQSGFLHTLEVGRQLFSMGDEETQGRLQSDLAALQEEWERLHCLLGRRMDLTQAVIKTWERCEGELAHSARMLTEVRARLEQPLPESDDGLRSARQFNKENEDSLEDWAQSLTELSTMKADLSQYIMADDVLLLQEQVEHLHCQWEELCLKVSLRKQEIADRLNAWIIFNEKNKELCEWLTQMENKVAHNSDLNIEEMVEKLKKDCMEEINLFSENKTHLKQLGEQLISASNRTKETEINDKLKDVNDRWCHLFDHIEERVKKLKETLFTVQQLDKNMSNLRTWLSHIEAELAKPVVYNVCHSEEIQRKLAEQQVLQRDIEQHTDSVASVLTLCDVLLHDADACGSDSENDSIQQTTRSLDRRWRNICAMSMERRMRIEETWRLWCKFLDDYSRFEDWLKTAELTAANPESADVLYTGAKEELKKFEGFQRQILERLTQLELLNKQYRRLARENRTDASSKLRVLVQDGNQRWDVLQRRVGCVLRRLKHFTCQREDFEGTREALLVWLTEMDLQLTNVEHFSESDIEDKMRQLHAFQQEITLNTNKIDALIVFGENLIQKSSPLDAVLIEDELEELHSYCQEVFGRVSRFHQRLVSRRPVIEEERNVSDLDDPPEVLNGVSWTETTARRRTRRTRRKVVEDENPALGRPTMCHLLPPPMEQSGRETPVSVDSIPLEWDHTVDVGGSSSHEDDDDAPFFSALSVKSVNSWELQQTSPERKPLHGYVKLMSECSGSIDRVKRVKLILNDEEELEEAGLSSSTESKQTGAGVIERWELLLAQKFGSDNDVRQDLEQWNKLNSDLCDVTSWLGRMLPELERLQRIAPSSSVRDIEGNIRKLKEMQRSFSSYKCLMISVNLSSRHFLHSAGSSELRELQDALSSANQSWMAACNGIESWERKLQAALLQCQEFHKALHALLLFLAEAENKLQSVSVGDSRSCRSALLQRQLTLTSLQEELRARQQQVSLLQDISSELLLRETGGEDGVEAQEKVHVIGNKLHLLLRRTSAELQHLQEATETLDIPESCGPAPPPETEEPAEPAAAGRVDGAPPADGPLLPRLLSAAVPLQLLLLLLLLLVCMVPLSDDAYSCTLSNNFARSFYPMLRYTNGPPPT